MKSVPNRKLNQFHKVPLKISEVLSLSKFQNTSDHESNAWRFQTQEGLNKIFNEDKYLLFRIVDQSSFSNASLVFEQRYYTKGSIKQGVFIYVPSLTIGN